MDVLVASRRVSRLLLTSPLAKKRAAWIGVLATLSPAALSQSAITDRWTVPLSGTGRAVADLGDVIPGGADDLVVFVQGNTSTFAVVIDAADPSILQFISAGGGPVEALGNVGDVNGDGVDDVMVSNPRGRGFSNFTNAGRASISAVGAPPFGAAQTVFFLSGTLPGEFVGAGMAGIGDVNGDGRDDWVVANQNSMQVYGFNTPTTSAPIGAPIPLSSRDVNGVTIPGSRYPMVGAGDVDGDLVPDWIVAQPGVRVDLYSGATRTPIVGYLPSASDVAGEQFGASVALLDGPLGLRVVIGAPEAETGAGRAYVYNVQESGVTATIDSTGLSGLGSMLEGGHDTNGDGHDDLLAGARRNDPVNPVQSSPLATAAYVVLSGNGFAELDASSTVRPRLATDKNGDGRADVVSIAGLSDVLTRIGMPSIRPFGAGCNGDLTVTPAVAGGIPTVPGAALNLNATNMVRSAGATNLLAFFFVGQPDSGGALLPGGLGCRAYVTSPTSIGPFGVSLGGAASTTLVIPTSPVLAGQTWAVQVLTYDSMSQLGSTNAVELTLSL